MNNIQPIRTNATDIRFHWLRCWYAQWHFRYYWRPVKHNLEEYWSKHCTSSHFREKRYKVSTPMCQLEIFWSAKEQIVQRGRLQISFPQRVWYGLGKVGPNKIPKVMWSQVKYPRWHHRDLIHKLTIDQPMTNILWIRLAQNYHDQWVTLGLETPLYYRLFVVP